MREYSHLHIIDDGEYLENYGNNGCFFCTVNSYLTNESKPILEWNYIKSKFDNLPKEGTMVDTDTHQLFLCEFANYLKVQLVFYSSPIPNILNEDICQIIGKVHSSNKRIHILKLSYNHYVLLNSSFDELEEISQENFNSKKQDYENKLKIEEEDTIKLINLLQMTYPLNEVEDNEIEHKKKTSKQVEKKTSKQVEKSKIEQKKKTSKQVEKSEIEQNEQQKETSKQVEKSEIEQKKKTSKQVETSEISEQNEQQKETSKQVKKSEISERNKLKNYDVDVLSFTEKLIKINNILEQLVQINKMSI